MKAYTAETYTREKKKSLSSVMANIEVGFPEFLFL
jgi:hypothetical protein